MPKGRDYTFNDFAPPDTVNLKKIRPFEEGERVDNGDGTFSTERSTNFNFNGEEVLVPSLWMTPDGPADLSRNPEVLIRAIQAYESRTKKKFPRFDDPQQAIEFSKQRSSMGGRGVGELMR